MWRDYVAVRDMTIVLTHVLILPSLSHITCMSANYSRVTRLQLFIRHVTALCPPYLTLRDCVTHSYIHRYVSHTHIFTDIFTEIFTHIFSHIFTDIIHTSCDCVMSPIFIRHETVLHTHIFTHICFTLICSLMYSLMCYDALPDTASPHVCHPLMCNMTHSYAWYDAVTCVTRLIHMRYNHVAHVLLLMCCCSCVVAHVLLLMCCCSCVSTDGGDHR